MRGPGERVVQLGGLTVVKSEPPWFHQPASLGAGIEKTLKEMRESQDANAKLHAVLEEFWKAAKTDDTATMEAVIEKLKTTGGSDSFMPRLKLQVATAKKDWPAALIPLALVVLFVLLLIQLVRT